jgi:hypothetical protein
MVLDKVKSSQGFARPSTGDTARSYSLASVPAELSERIARNIARGATNSMPLHALSMTRRQR